MFDAIDEEMEADLAALAPAERLRPPAELIADRCQHMAVIDSGAAEPSERPARCRIKASSLKMKLRTTQVYMVE